MDPKKQAAFEQRLQEKFRLEDLEAVTTAIVESYGPEVLGYLVRTMRSKVDASEVFSQFCEDLCRGIAGFERRSSFRTWVYRLATSARARFWLDPFRRRGRRLMTDELAKIEEQVRSRTLPHLRTEVKGRFAQLRSRLDPDEQSLLTLRVDKKMSWTEVAEVLAKPDEPLTEPELQSRAAAWRQRFKRLKDRLRAMAQEEGLIESDE
jgi:RNA polymerase sigma-70 factor (ECF subfamily)